MLGETDVAQYRFYIQIGTPFRRVIEFKTSDGSAYDLTSHTFRCPFRKPPRGVGSILFSDISVLEGAAAAGTIALTLTNVQTGSLKRGSYNGTVYLTYPNTEERAFLKCEFIAENVD